jgi:hypothetical protein
MVQFTLNKYTPKSFKNNLFFSFSFSIIEIQSSNKTAVEALNLCLSKVIDYRKNIANYYANSDKNGYYYSGMTIFSTKFTLFNKLCKTYFEKKNLLMES